MPSQSGHKTVFKNAIFEVQEFEVEFENGNKKTFSRLIKKDSVVIVPVTKDREIVFIREYHAAVDKTFLTLPGGRLDDGEQPEEAAQRELQEETGFKAKTVKPVTELLMSPGYLQQTSYGFLATDLLKVEQNLDKSEQIKVELHSIKELDTLIASKQLIEARDIALCLSIKDQYE